MEIIKRFILIFVFFIFIVSCQANEQNMETKPIIYTSIYPLEFVVDQLTENFAITKTIFPPGVDAHTYEPTIKDILAIADGEAFIYLGKGMEGSADKISEALNHTDVTLIEIGQYTEIFLEADEDDDGQDGHSHGDYDPHIWFDPERMITLSEIVKDELNELFPENRQIIAQNFNKLAGQLTELDEQFSRRLQHKENPHIIVSHAAYGYWEHKYHIKQMPISGISSTDEPSQKALAHLVELAKTYDLEYVLFEKTTSNRLATIVQEEIGAKSLYIHNLETLLPEDIEQRKDYFSIMQDNLNTLDEATK